MADKETSGDSCHVRANQEYFSKIHPGNTDNCVPSHKQPYMVFFLFFPLKALF